MSLARPYVRPSLNALAVPIFGEFLLGMTVAMAGLYLASHTSDAAAGSFGLTQQILESLFVVFRVLAIGMGGTATELHGDVAYVRLPTTPARLARAIARLKLATLLAGFRGQPAADTDALLAAACALGDRFVALQPAVSELEINPLFVHVRGSGRVVAVDALLTS